MPTKLFVANIPPGSSQTELQQLFEKYGKVTECDIIKDYAFVHFESEDDAKVAMKELNEADFAGAKIEIQMSRKQGINRNNKTTAYRNRERGDRRNNLQRGGGARGGRDRPPMGGREAYDGYFDRQRLDRAKPYERYPRYPEYGSAYYDQQPNPNAGYSYGGSYSPYNYNGYNAGYTDYYRTGAPPQNTGYYDSGYGAPSAAYGNYYQTMRNGYDRYSAQGQPRGTYTSDSYQDMYRF